MFKLCLLMAAIMDGGRGHRTQFLKYTPQGPSIPCLLYWLTQEEKILKHFFPQGLMLKLCPLMVAILDGGLGQWI